MFVAFSPSSRPTIRGNLDFRFAIVIVSNQASTKKNTVEQWKQKMPLIADQVGVRGDSHITVCSPTLTCVSPCRYPMFHSEYLLLADMMDSENQCLGYGQNLRK